MLVRRNERREIPTLVLTLLFAPALLMSYYDFSEVAEMMDRLAA